MSALKWAFCTFGAISFAGGETLLILPIDLLQKLPKIHNRHILGTRVRPKELDLIRRRKHPLLPILHLLIQALKSQGYTLKERGES